jgi:hypothetical protein
MWTLTTSGTWLGLQFVTYNYNDSSHVNEGFYSYYYEYYIVSGGVIAIAVCCSILGFAILCGIFYFTYSYIQKRKNKQRNRTAASNDHTVIEPNVHYSSAVPMPPPYTYTSMAGAYPCTSDTELGGAFPAPPLYDDITPKCNDHP